MNKPPALPLRFFVYHVALTIVFGVFASVVKADNTKEASPLTPPVATLVTNLGDHLPGHWLATDDLEAIDWQVKGFVQPFQIAKESLTAIHFQHQTKVPSIEGTYRCELSNGDLLFGTPLSMDEDGLVLEIAGSGPLRIHRNHLRKLSPRIDSDQTVHSTPTSLSEWEGSVDGWKESAGRITAVQDNVTLKTSLALGLKSQTTIHLAWESRPDFRIDFGSTSEGDSGLRLETWEGQLVLVAESSSAANVLLVSDSLSQDGELLLHLFVDAHQQTILVTSETGDRLGEFAWPGKLESAFKIQSIKKGLHFYSATVAPWDGTSPELLNPTQSGVRYKAGNLEPATVTAWDPESQEWTVAIEGISSEGDDPETGGTEKRVSSDAIDSLLFTSEAVEADKPEESEVKFDSVRVLSWSGMKFTGEIVRLTHDAIEIRCQGIEAPFSLSLANLQDIVFLKANPKEADSPTLPRLQIGNASIVGQLIDAESTNQATALVWKPTASKTAAAISHDASGTITYRVPPPPKDKPTPQQQQKNTGILGGIARLFSQANTASQPKETASELASGPTLHLRSGDSIPCQPKRIDSEGVTFNSPVIEATFVPHETMKALSLVGKFQPARMTEEQRDRFLTLPRAQQEHPPTHLLLSVDGDLLRTRVATMDDKHLTLEVRFDTVQLPRKKVAAIAWLHKDELPRENEEEPAVNPAGPFLHVQAVRSDKVRLTFHPQKFAEGAIVGRSEVLGNCRVEVSQVDKLLFGQAIQEDRQHQSHQLLALKPAIVPNFVTADNSTPTIEGQGSALVGQPAPPIQLMDITGKKFNLADRRGKVVVLDFWATWCGPCIQWMPQLEEVVADYSDEEVELITVNLLQDKEAIEPALERMGINPAVLLDIDGVVADAYQATAIPQTVIIDQEGKVTRLFIGGSSQIKQPLIEALDELTSQPAAN